MVLRLLAGVSIVLVGTAFGACGGGDGATNGNVVDGTSTAADAGNGGGTPDAALTATPDVELTAVGAARADLAARFERPPEEVEVISVDLAEWPDACLGAPGPDEVCAQVITPGYEIELRLDESTYTFRTDKTGATVRFADLDIGSDD
jgi:hypothetical protein